MSNFRLTLPTYLETSWNQLSHDGSFDRQDLAKLKQAAQSQQGSKIQEALETQTIDTLEQRLKTDADGSLKLDKVQVHPQAQNLGHAIVEVSLLPDQTPASASAQVASSSGTPTTEPSRDDMIWAADIELRLKQQQTVPTEDIEKYKNICQRFLDSRKGKPLQAIAKCALQTLFSANNWLAKPQPRTICFAFRISTPVRFYTCRPL